MKAKPRVSANEDVGMEAVKGHNTPSSFGELVLQNGRQAGTRRALDQPTTLIGRGTGCDIRLNLDGIDNAHCIISQTPEGLHIRDLDSAQGIAINEQRTRQAPLRDGDLVQIGPFQFRIELPRAAVMDAMPVEELREALRIQAAAVAAQQIGLEEEELRLQERTGDLRQQEEQLAAHLAEKQRQIRLATEATKADRDALRKERVEHDRHRAKVEQEFLRSREELAKEKEKLTSERQRVGRVYQRLRQRWKEQWVAERQKHERQAEKLLSERRMLEEHQDVVRLQESAIRDEIVSFNTERELTTRRLRDERIALKKDQQSWRRRRSLEWLAIKNKQRAADDAVLKLQEARQQLQHEKKAWDEQVKSLERELHGLNNRIVNQRARVQEQAEEIARLDAAFREHQAQEALMAEPAIECEVEVVADAPPVNENATKRLETFEQLTSELSDQRAHLLEQFTRLAEIQEAWQLQRDQSAAELEAIAQRLARDEEVLVQREQSIAATETYTLEHQRQIDAIRQEMLIARARWQSREQAFEREHQQTLEILRRHDAALQEQLAGLAPLRQRWNRRRQEEVKELSTKRALVQQLQKETHEVRIKLFDKDQQLAEEKRILSEKSLALEQYRQEVFFRAKDPAAERRVERLRRRWLSLNASLIRAAKNERDLVKRELSQLDELRAELTTTMNRIDENQAAVNEKESEFDEREAQHKARHEHLENEAHRLEQHRQSAEADHLRFQDEIDTIAKTLFEANDPPAIDKAA